MLVSLRLCRRNKRNIKRSRNVKFTGDRELRAVMSLFLGKLLRSLPVVRVLSFEMFLLYFSVVLADFSDQRCVDFGVVILLVRKDLVIVDAPFVLGHQVIELSALLLRLHLLTQFLNVLVVLTTQFLLILFFVVVYLLQF